MKKSTDVKPNENFNHMPPHLAKEWHPTKNGKLSLGDMTKGSHTKVWWKCPITDDHEWIATIYHRAIGRGCPYCSGNRVSPAKSLALLKPTLADEWHPTKNGKLSPFNFSTGSKN